MGRKTAPQHRGPPGQVMPHEPEEEQGPIKNRSCTDIICLLFFMAFFVAFIAVGGWAMKEGNLDLLAVPEDSEGQRCGVDANVKDKPYLFFFDITKCFSITTAFSGCDTTQLCVEKCPNFTYINGYVNNTEYTKYCIQNATVGKCPSWIVNSDPVNYRCIPNLDAITTHLEQIQTLVGSEDDTSFENSITSTLSNMKWFTALEQMSQQIISDIVNCWKEIAIGIVLSLVCCMIYIFMLRWIAGIMVWFSIASMLAGLSVALYFVSKLYMKWRDDYTVTSVSTSKTKRDIFLSLIVVIGIALTILLLILIFLRKRIVMAIALVKEGSKAVGSVTSVLFFPIVPWIFQFGIIAYSVFVGAYLMTTGKPIYKYTTTNLCNITGTIYDPDSTEIPSHSDSCGNITYKYVGQSNQEYYPYFQGINVFGFFWLTFFMSAFGQLVLAQVFARWYWTRNKSNLPFFAVTSAALITVRYHLGTVAFGSLIIAICRIIRICLEYIDKKLKKYDNGLVKAIMCCLKCFFWCLEKFLKFINKNAYIMCAIHGKNFCSSAKDAFSLLVRNILRVFVLDKITDFLFFLSKLIVTLGVGAVAYLLFATDSTTLIDNSKIQYQWVPVVIIMVATYLIATLFFNVYSMAVDTLFLCFLEDLEHNNGKDRKYFMSKSLMKVFGKRNKTDKID